jgi:hypothetical protein
METKHTSGPWIINDHMAKDKRVNCFWYKIQDDSGNTIAEVKGRHCGINNSTAEANAKLIVAGLKMLEALIEISEGKGRYDLDPIQHAVNCIEDMKALALEAIEEATE